MFTHKILLVFMLVLFTGALLTETSAQVSVRNSKEVFNYYGISRDSIKLGGFSSTAIGSAYGRTTVFKDSVRLGDVGQPVIFHGTASPVGLTVAKGSIYIRNAGIADSTLYLRTNDSTWVAVK